MRCLCVMTMVGLLNLSLFAAEEKARTITFNKDDLGKLPKGWTAAVTGGKAEGSVWKLEEDKDAPGGPLVLSQTSKNPGSVFNVCICDEGKYKDLDISIAFKPREGKSDQGGGIIWRVQDKDNFYIVRMNPLEDNFWLYRTLAGRRMSLVRVPAKAEAGKWHTMRVVMVGNKMQCYLNDKLMIEHTDDTFKEAGKIGLWTKADAQSSFSDIKVTPK
jgi:hypothetical protein